MWLKGWCVLPFSSFFYPIFGGGGGGGALSAEYSIEVKQINGSGAICCGMCVSVYVCVYVCICLTVCNIDVRIII